MIPIAKVIVRPTEPTGKNRKKVWMQKGKNLFNKDDAIIDGYYIDNSGNLISASNSWYQNAFIKVKSNTQYTMSSGHGILRVCFYDNNKNYISRNTTEKTSLTFLTPSNCEYVKLSGDTSSIQILDLQLEQGPNKTYYEAYIEPKIYIKNINDVYEEFTEKNEEKYSTSETKIGTWIDGKPLYRKVFIGTINETTTGTFQDTLIDMNINNVDKKFIDKAFYIDQYNDSILIPYITNSGYIIKAMLLNKNVLRIMTNSSAFNGLTFYVVVNYTKTTD